MTASLNYFSCSVWYSSSDSQFVKDRHFWSVFLLVAQAKYQLKMLTFDLSFSNLTLVFKLTLLQDVLYPGAAHPPLSHTAFFHFSHSRYPNYRAQCHLMPGMGADPPLPLPPRKPVLVAGPGHPHYCWPAHDLVAPPPVDRLVYVVAPG